MYLCIHFDGHFDSHRDAAVLYRVHCPMEEVQGFHKPLNTAIGRALTPIASIGHVNSAIWLDV